MFGVYLCFVVLSMYFLAQIRLPKVNASVSRCPQKVRFSSYLSSSCFCAMTLLFHFEISRNPERGQSNGFREFAVGLTAVPYTVYRASGDLPAVINCVMRRVCVRCYNSMLYIASVSATCLIFDDDCHQVSTYPFSPFFVIFSPLCPYPLCGVSSFHTTIEAATPASANPVTGVQSVNSLNFPLPGEQGPPCIVKVRELLHLLHTVLGLFSVCLRMCFCFVSPSGI